MESINNKLPDDLYKRISDFADYTFEGAPDGVFNVVNDINNTSGAPNILNGQVTVSIHEDVPKNGGA